MSENVRAVLADAAERLAEAGVEDARAEARRLLAAVWRAGGEVGPDPRFDDAAPLEPSLATAFAAALERRRAREPVAHILGQAAFREHVFAVSPAVLTPRPESELIVEALLSADAPPGARVLDLGVGSGALVLSVLAHKPAAWGVGVDRSAHALVIAKDNARRLGLADRVGLICADWDGALAARFDLIACNPPYIASAAVSTLAPEVRDAEPWLALDGGADGLDPYRRLLPQLPTLLAPGGTAAFECGAGQGQALMKLCASLGGAFTCAVKQDLAGLDRLLTVERAPETN